MLKLTSSGTYKTVLGDQTVPYAVKRSPRAKYVRLQVGVRSGLTVVVPASYDIDAIPGLLKKKTRWILDKLTKYTSGHRNGAPKGLRSGDSIPYLGRPLRVEIGHSSEIAGKVTLGEEGLLVILNSGSAPPNMMLEWWYRQQAEKMIRKRADEMCPRMGVSYARLTIRAARTRWGSCSGKGNLNFNWKLVMAPEAVIDYVVIHELAHLREMNHSRKFWELVAEHCPEWRVHRQWLKEHGAELTSKLSG